MESTALLLYNTDHVRRPCLEIMLYKYFFYVWIWLFGTLNIVCAQCRAAVLICFREKCLLLEGKKIRLVAHFHHSTCTYNVHAYTHIHRFSRPAGLLIKLNDEMHLGNNIDNKWVVSYLQHWLYKMVAVERLIKNIKNSSHQKREGERAKKRGKINYVRVCLQRRRRRWRTTSLFLVIL